MVRWHGFRAHGFSIAKNAPIVSLLTSVIAEMTGAPAFVSPMFGTADARYFADRLIPAVYYGPAGGGMHAPDEWVTSLACGESAAFWPTRSSGGAADGAASRKLRAPSASGRGCQKLGNRTSCQLHPGKAHDPLRSSST